MQLIPATGAVQTRREYLMTDALGSTRRVVSEQAAIIPDGKQAFATFGERANAADRSTLTEVDQANFSAVLPRGYTGHQQADEVGIIHMNGRIYDPRLGRFLQADPLMEDIFDPQAIRACERQRLFINRKQIKKPSTLKLLGFHFYDLAQTHIFLMKPNSAICGCDFFEKWVSIDMLGR